MKKYLETESGRKIYNYKTVCEMPDDKHDTRNTLILGLLTFFGIMLFITTSQIVEAENSNYTVKNGEYYFQIKERPLLNRYKLHSLFEKNIWWKKDFLPDGTDLDKLAMAVAMHETGNCKIKTNFSIHNNCFGIILSNGIARYDTIEEAHEHFKDIWRRMYGRFPDLKLARRYSGNDRSEAWLADVTYFFNQL